MIGLDLGNLLIHLRLDDGLFTRGIRQAENKLQQFSTNLDSIGRKLTTRLTVPLTLFSGVTVKNAISLENAFAGIIKTVDATEQQLESLRQEFNALARGPIASSVEELYSLGEAAGQLGIQLPNIVKFAKTMADLGVSTNLTSQEAAVAFAQISNVMQMPQEQVENLASSLVHLGNTSATNEKQIMDMAQRISAAGSIAALSASDVLGLAAAFSSVGLRAEAGGSAVARILIDMTGAVRGQTQELRTFARVASVSIEEFSNQFRENGALALTQFIEGLARIDREGGNVIRILDNLGLEGIRVTQALLSAGNAGDLVRRSLEGSAQAFKANIALTEEANKRYQTLGSRFIRLKNEIKLSFEAIGEVIGQRLLSIGEVVLVPFLRWFEGLSAETRVWAVTLTLTAAAIGPLTLALSGLLKVTSLLLATYGGLIAASFSWIGASILLAGVAYTLYTAWVQNLTAIKDRMQEWGQSFSDTLEWLQNSALGQFLMGMVRSFQHTFDIIRKGWRDFIADSGASAIAAGKWIQQIMKGLGEAWEAPTIDSAIMRFRMGMIKAREEFSQGFVDAWEDLRPKVDDLANVTIDKYQTLTLTLKALGQAEVEHLEVLMGALKKQFAEDFEDIVATLKTNAPDMAKAIDDVVEKLNEATEQTNQFNDSVDELVRKFAEFPNISEQISSGFQIAADDMEDSMSSWGDRAEDIIGAVQQGYFNMLSNTARDTGNWKDHILNALEEIYYRSLEIAFFEPLSQAAASTTAQIGKAIFSGLGGALAGGFGSGGSGTIFSGGGNPGGVAPAGTAPVAFAHSGGLLGKANLPQVMAPIAAYTSAPRFHSGGRGEMAIWARENEHVLTADQMNYLVGSVGSNSGIGSIRLINESGTSLQITRQEEYMMSDERIIDVVLAGQTLDGRLRRSQKRMGR